MEAYWGWWLAALVLVIAEMFSGSFYLLAIAAGGIVAGLAAYFGAGWVTQATAATLSCLASVALVYRWRKRQNVRPPEQINLAYDIGQSVHVVQWTGDRRARVSYRGAEWDAELASDAPGDSARQTWRIREIRGSQLIIE